MCGSAKSTKEMRGSFFLPGAGPHATLLGNFLYKVCIGGYS